MKLCGKEVTHKQKVGAGITITLMLIASMITLLVIGLYKATKCPNETDWVTCEVSRDFIPTTSGYKYTVGCDKSTGGGNVPGFYFTRDSLTQFTMSSTYSTMYVVFMKNSALGYFWPTWEFILNGTEGEMGYNLFGIVNKYSIRWPSNNSEIGWYTEKILPNIIPGAIKVYNKKEEEKQDADSEMFHFNSKISLTKSYTTCLKKTVAKNPKEVLVAMGVVVSYALHDD